MASHTFYQYPPSRKGPDVPYKNAPGRRNPVLRGRYLGFAAAIIRHSNYVQSFLYKGNNFHQLRNIKDLDSYEPRYDPTVIPSSPPASTNVTDPPPSAREVRADHGDSVRYSSALDYHAVYLAQALTPTAVVDTLLPLIRRDTVPKGVHSVAFLDSKVELIRAAAAASTERYKAGNPLSSLDGVPIALKDEVDLAGYKTTLGSRLDFTHPSGETSWCVRKLEEAGAIVIGKTNMHELGLDTNGNNPHTGTPRNPHNPAYYTGGSSSGSAYAVSAGLVPIALGADGGGSIRLPASFCGVYGLKTTHGQVTGEPTVGIATTTGVFGPIAGSLEDLALSYRIMSQPHPTSTFPDPCHSSDPPRPKVLGVFRQWVERADTEVLTAFENVITLLNARGYTVIDHDDNMAIPYLPEGQKAHTITIMTEIASALVTTPKKKLSQLQGPNKVLMCLCGPDSAANSQDFIAAQKLRNLLMQHLAYLFKKYPGLIIVTPTAPKAGLKIRTEKDLTHGVSDGDSTLKSMEFVYLANFTGCPAITCPMGYAEESKIPLGIMGMAEWGSEEHLIEWGRDVESALSPPEDQDVASAASTDIPSSSPSAQPEKAQALLRKPATWVDVIATARSSPA